MAFLTSGSFERFFAAVYIGGMEQLPRHSLPPFEGTVSPRSLMRSENGASTPNYSCEGGEGRAWRTPPVRFRGDKHQAFQALALVYRMGYRVRAFRKVWLFAGLDLHAPPRADMRIANVGTSFQLRDPENADALAIFVFWPGPGTDSPKRRIWICRYTVETDVAEDLIGPVEPGFPAPWGSA